MVHIRYIYWQYVHASHLSKGTYIIYLEVSGYTQNNDDSRVRVSPKHIH